MLGGVWPPGGLGGAIRLYASNRIILWGHNNDLRQSRFGDGSSTPITTLFCIEPAQFSGQCPPYLAGSVPRADLLWYKMLAPQGREVIKVSADVELGPRGAEIEVQTAEGWRLYLDADGPVLDTARTDSGHPVPSSLLDVIPAAKPK